MTKLPKGTVAIMAVVTKGCLCVRMLCCDCFPGVVVCRRDVWRLGLLVGVKTKKIKTTLPRIVPVPSHLLGTRVMK